MKLSTHNDKMHILALLDENDRLREALKHAEEIINAHFATPTTQEGRIATVLMNQIRTSLIPQ